jgi:alpha-ketoglutarate-dependent taurine dioxygenase
MEFDELAGELRFFKSLGLDVDAVQIEVPLRPGDLLVFDNLALAHRRSGSRRPGELHQRVYGHRCLSPTAQRALRDRFLAAFAEHQLDSPRTSVSMS